MSARLSSLYSKSNIIQASYVLARNVGCTSEYAKEIVHCLREVSSEQILNIFLIQYQVSLISILKCFY